ncbi:MaoC family dehydratase [Aquirhabdus sp.]|uniref:MaoC family dehydratase n=1 Tax=Aquirhabdus sp. TaxID=2824160 RepID=UPI00396C57C3
MPNRTFESIPNPIGLFAKVALSTIKKNPYKTLPEAEYTVTKLKIDREHLNAYNKICGYPNLETLPPLYLGIRAMTLQLALMVNEAFPFPILGIVHIRNTVEQFKPVSVNDTIQLSTRFGEITPHEKGKLFTFISTAKVNNEVVWESVAYYLARGKSDVVVDKSKPKEARLTQKAGDINVDFDLPEDLGRRYAKVSGDFNFIHIHKFTAQAFGFKRAIAHGMWTKARSVAALGELPPAYFLDVQFKLPVFLPGKVHLHAQKKAKVTTFELTDAKDGKPHLVGTLTAR